MHTVTCPKCKKVLMVPHAVSKARIHCTGCDAMFVASSTPVDPAARSPEPELLQTALVRSTQADRRKTRLYRGRQKPPTSISPTAIAVAGAGVVGVVILAIVCAHLASRPPADADKAPESGGAATRPNGVKTPGESARPGPGARKPADPTGGPRPGPGTPDDGRKPEPTANKPENDLLIKVTYRRRTDDYGNVTLYGEVRNTHKYPVRHAALTFVFPGEDGKEAKASTVCNHVPVMGAVAFSVKLGQLPEGVSPAITATSVPEPEGTVCWRVETGSVRLDTETVKGAVVINGRVTNATETTVTDVELHCDFFWRTGQYHSTAVGKLTKAMRIGPGKTESYRVALANVLAPSGISDQTILRLVGRAVR